MLLPTAKLLPTVLIGSAALCCNSVLANEQLPDFSEMNLNDLMNMELFTSASLLPTQMSKAPGTVYSFRHDQFKRYGVRSLDDLLQFVPGIQSNQYRKRHRSIWAHGLLERYNDKLVLLVDGVRVQHLYYGHFSLNDAYPLEMIEKVEIILGPASSLYGANAFGGIISISTKEFAKKEQLSATTEVADNERFKGTVLYNSPSFQGFASVVDQDAPFSTTRKSFIGGEVLQPLDEDYQNFNLKTTPYPGLSISINYQQNEVPFLNIPNTQDAFIDSDMLSFTVAYDYGDIESGRIESRFYYQDDNALEYEKEQVTQALGYEEHQDATMAGLSLTGLKRYSDHTLALGLSANYEKADNTRFERSFHFADGFLDPTVKGDLLSTPNVENLNYAVFLQDVWRVNNDWELTLGARYDEFDQFGDYLNYRVAAVYTLSDTQTIKAQYGTAIRTPTLREYLKVLEGTVFVPPVVGAEKIKSMELGYIHQWDQANLNINLFHNSLDDYIHEVPTPDDEDEYFTNSDETTRMQGIDALVNFRPQDNLNLRIALSYLETDSNDGELPYLASWSGSFKLDYRYLPDHTLGFSLIHNSDRRDLNGFDDEADNFIISNLFAFGDISSDISYQAGIDNLFDKKVYDPAGDFGWQHNNEKSERVIWLQLKWNNLF